MRKVLWITINTCDRTNCKTLRNVQKSLKDSGINSSLTFPYPTKAVVSASRKNIDTVIAEYAKILPKCQLDVCQSI